MTKEKAYEIAEAYQQKYNFNTRINESTKVVLYNDFEFVDGPAWIVEANLPPSNFEGTDTLTYVVSIKFKRVEYIINSSGFPKFPHGKYAEFSDEDLDELRDAGFDILE